MALSHREVLGIAGAGAALAIGLVVVPPVAQDPRYHAFADARTIAGVPNFWNVATNAAFVVAALWGLRALGSRTAFAERWERAAYAALMAGTALAGVGSTYYHLNPTDTRLLWDRLPMTVVFMSLLAATAGERMSGGAGKRLLVPLLLLGLGSVVYWAAAGDLRLYGLVQFGAMLAVPLLLLLRPPRYTGTGAVWGMAALYAVAKAAELMDRRMVAVVATGGHPWKHVAAAGAILWYGNGVARRRVLAQG
jgi:hypothetical protein